MRKVFMEVEIIGGDLNLATPAGCAITDANPRDVRVVSREEDARWKVLGCKCIFHTIQLTRPYSGHCQSGSHCWWWPEPHWQFPMEPFPVGFDHVKVKFSGPGTSLLTLTLPSSSFSGEYFVFCLPLPQRNGRRWTIINAIVVIFIWVPGRVLQFCLWSIYIAFYSSFFFFFFNAFNDAWDPRRATADSDTNNLRWGKLGILIATKDHETKKQPRELLKQFKIFVLTSCDVSGQLRRCFEVVAVRGYCLAQQWISGWIFVRNQSNLV